MWIDQDCSPTKQDLTERGPLQPANLLLCLEIKGPKSASLNSESNLESDSGRPRYICGKEATGQPNKTAIPWATCWSTFIGRRVLLSKFMWRPVASEKSVSSNLRRRYCSCWRSPFSTIRVWSAYCNTGHGLSATRGCSNSPLREARWINCCRISATRINWYGMYFMYSTPSNM